MTNFDISGNDVSTSTYTYLLFFSLSASTQPGEDGGSTPDPSSPSNPYRYYHYPSSVPSNSYRAPPRPGDGRGPPARPFPPPPDFDPGLVRPEEAAIVGAVLALWACAVVLFVRRWGKIRMLVPHQPRYAYAEANADKLKVTIIITC